MIATVILATAIAGTAMADTTRDARLANFLQGIGVGLSIEVGNVTACTTDLKVSLEHFDAALNGVSAGITGKDRIAVASALGRLGEGFSQISEAFQACGLFDAADSTNNLVKTFKVENPFSVDDTLAIRANSAPVTEDMLAAVKYWQSNNQFQSGVYHGRVMHSLLGRSTLNRRVATFCTKATGTKVSHVFSEAFANFDDLAAQQAIANVLNLDRKSCIGAIDVESSGTTQTTMQYTIRISTARDLTKTAAEADAIAADPDMNGGGFANTPSADDTAALANAASAANLGDRTFTTYFA